MTSMIRGSPSSGSRKGPQSLVLGEISGLLGARCQSSVAAVPAENFEFKGVVEDYVFASGMTLGRVNGFGDVLSDDLTVRNLT